MSWHVYIAEARTGGFYTGITTDPQRRIGDHNRGKGAKLAQDQGVFAIRYVSPPFPDKFVARKHEIQIKGWTREKKEKLTCEECNYRWTDTVNEQSHASLI